MWLRCAMIIAYQMFPSLALWAANKFCNLTKGKRDHLPGKTANAMRAGKSREVESGGCGTAVQSFAALENSVCQVYCQPCEQRQQSRACVMLGFHCVAGTHQEQTINSVFTHASVGLSGWLQSDSSLEVGICVKSSVRTVRHIAQAVQYSTILRE